MIVLPCFKNLFVFLLSYMKVKKALKYHKVSTSSDVFSSQANAKKTTLQHLKEALLQATKVLQTAKSTKPPYLDYNKKRGGFPSLWVSCFRGLAFRLPRRGFPRYRTPPRLDIGAEGTRRTRQRTRLPIWQGVARQCRAWLGSLLQGKRRTRR